MENGKTYGKQTPEEVARAAQKVALKSAMEQAQSMLGNISGMNMRDMQAQIMAQMQAAVPNPSKEDLKCYGVAGMTNVTDCFVRWNSSCMEWILHAKRSCLKLFFATIMMKLSLFTPFRKVFQCSGHTDNCFG